MGALCWALQGVGHCSDRGDQQGTKEARKGGGETPAGCRPAPG